MKAIMFFALCIFVFCGCSHKPQTMDPIDPIYTKPKCESFEIANENFGKENNLLWINFDFTCLPSNPQAKWVCAEDQISRTEGVYISCNELNCRAELDLALVVSTCSKSNFYYGANHGSGEDSILKNVLILHKGVSFYEDESGLLNKIGALPK